MAEPDLILAVKREDGESLVLNGLTLARAFFTGAPNGSLLIRDVEVQAVACLQGRHQGLQLPGRGRI